MKVSNNLKDLGITLDELYKPIDGFYPAKQINIHISNKDYVFHVVLVDVKGIDCKISSMGANLWFRTPKGTNFEKYKSLNTLQKVLVGYIERYVDSIDNLSFSLSDDVYNF